MSFINKLLIYLVGCFILAACSTITPQAVSHAPSRTWAKRQAQLQKLNQWTTTGSVGMRTPQEGWGASFSWQQKPKSFQLQLFAPLGAGSLNLTGQQGRVELTTSKGEHYQASNTQALLYDRTGWYLPVELLRFWIRGIPAPGSAAKLSFDTAQRLIKLEQQDWEVEYQAYATVNQFELPTRINLHNPYFTLLIIIRQWTL